MTSLSVKKLFRRCLLIALISVAAGCTSVKQMPSYTEDPVERSLVIESKVEELKHSPLVVPGIEVLNEDLVLETSVKEEKLVDYISTKFKVSKKVALNVVNLANKHAHETFPKRDDILAIIAVESQYDIFALAQGCYGLMQIQRKSHKKVLKGRSLHNPDVNVELGSGILNQYFVLLNGSKKAAVLSFNAGIGNYKNKRFRLAYYEKYSAELKTISNL